jgi:YD repeat-containing protein
LTQIAHDGDTFTLTYTNGKLTGVTDSANRSVSFAYAGDNLTAYTNPDGDAITFAYDISGRMTNIYDFSGALYVETEYDSRSRVTSQYMAGYGTGIFGYDPENRVNSFTDPTGEVKYYHYDGMAISSKSPTPTAISTGIPKRATLWKNPIVLVRRSPRCVTMISM